MRPTHRVQSRVVTLLLAALAIAALVVAAPTAARPDAKSKERAGELIVAFEPGVSESERGQVLAKAAAKAAKKLGKASVKLARTDPDKLTYALKVLNADPRVRYAEPNFEVSLALTPNDPSFGQLWGLHNTGQTVTGTAGTADSDIDAPEAWNVATGSRSVVVAVVDTGVDFSHPDLGGSATTSPLMWRNAGETGSGKDSNGVDDDRNGYIDDWRGWDFVNNDNNPFDDHDHGTHVAGTIGAQGGNGTGVTGVNWNVTIMALKFLDATGGGSTADAIEAWRYAASFGVPVVNNSWGGTQYSQALADVVTEEQDVLFLAAAGNSGLNADTTPHYPSSLPGANLVSVAATDSRDLRASFSNYGARSVDLGAPGDNILSTVPGGGYAYLDGTSMATPHVAGVAALALSVFGGATAPGLKALLLGTVDPKSSMNGITTSGGRLNAATAVTCTDDPQVLIDEPASGFTASAGQPVAVRIIAGVCGRTGATVSATVNGDPLALTARGDGVHTGSFTPATGSITINATATAAGGSDSASVTGTAAPNYSFADAPYAWLDPTSGGTKMTLGDDASVTVTLPFSFSYYGTAYTSLKVSSNGYLVFGSSAATEYQPAPIPTSTAPNGLVAPLWDDLNPTAGGGVWRRTVGTSPNRKFVVGWIGVPHFLAGAATFEVVLEEGTNAIVFQYQDASFEDSAHDYGASGTVGVENLAGSAGAQFLHAEPRLVGYPEEKSIRFTYGSAAPPDTTPPDTTITAGPSGTVASTTATFEFTATETGSTFACSLDGAAFTGCTSPKTYTGLSATTHTFRVRATDAANNTDLSPAERTWTVSSASCTRSGATMNVVLPTGAGAVIGRSGTSIVVNGIGLADPTCGGATVSNVDTIDVQGTGSDESLTIDLAVGPLGPGATAESSGTSEIELTVALGAGTDSLIVLGSSAADKLRLGSTAVALNGDTDGDVTPSGVEDYRVAGMAGNDTITGAGGSGTGTALAAAAALEGGDGSDTVTGGTGGDRLDGGLGTDTLDGALGADLVVGGGGTDTATYATRAVGVVVSLDDLPNDGAAGEGDDVRSDVENLRGGSGGDTLVGSALVNALTGNAGNDTLDGGLGNDTLTPGDGADTMIGGGGTADTVVYSGSAAVTVTLDDVANDGVAGEDNVGADVERVTGASGADQITGNAAVNLLKGQGGNDTLDGGGGKDTLDGGDGADTIDSRDGIAETVKCGAGTDTVTADTSDTVNSDCENVTRS